MKRLFLAADLSIPAVERLVRAQEELGKYFRNQNVKVRWVDPTNIHVTLKFIGEQDEAIIPMVCDQVRQLARPLFPFDVECKGFDAFPNVETARILWAGLDAKGAEVMGLLNQALDNELAELGIEADDREFKAHVTLGRIKSETPVDVSAVQAQLSEESFGSSYIRDIALFESVLTSDGPEYNVIERFALGE